MKRAEFNSSQHIQISWARAYATLGARLRELRWKNSA
jgi:hypothetical protein